jgi:Cys-tRNA(Pro) deacylase
VIFGGLVFQELSSDYLSAFGREWQTKAPTPLMFIYSYLNEATLTRRRLLILTNVLADSFNAGYEKISNLILNSVNGRQVASVDELKIHLKLPGVQRSGEEFAQFEFRNGAEIVLPYKGLDLSHKRIAKTYSVSQSASFFAREGYYSMSIPDSPAIALLQRSGIKFSVHQFEYQEGGGTPRSSHLLGVDEHAVIKTLVFESDQRQPMIVLMHGDRNVDTRLLSQQCGLSKIWSCAPAIAENLSGWPVGATNPFALKTRMPIFMEETVKLLPVMYINGGGRGLLVSMTPEDFLKVIAVRLVRCAKEKPMIVSKSP